MIQEPPEETKQLQAQVLSLSHENEALKQRLHSVTLELEESQIERVSELEQSKQEKEETFEQLCLVLGVTKKVFLRLDTRKHGWPGRTTWSTSKRSCW